MESDDGRRYNLDMNEEIYDYFNEDKIERNYSKLKAENINLSDKIYYNSIKEKDENLPEILSDTKLF